MVDEAKAFCPGCGNAFVEEEKRQDRSNFEKLDNTVQLGNTMYNQMLSDMGLNISKAPEKPEKRIEVIAPIATTPPAKKAPAKAPRSGSSSKLLWIVLGVLVVLPLAVLTAYLLARAVVARF